MTKKLKIEVITANVGGKDFLREDQVMGDAKFICYTDNPDAKSDVWEMRKAYDLFKDPRRNSRIHKILIHKYSDADITIWIDANSRFIMTPEEAVEKYLGDYDVVMFRHGGRDCIYDEAMEVARLGLDDVELIIEQAKYYEDRDFPKHRGLMSGFFIIRRNNAKTQALNEAWWADYCRFCRRDQISFMPAVDKSGVRINPIPEKWVQWKDKATIGGIVALNHHRHFEGNWNEKK